MTIKQDIYVYEKAVQHISYSFCTNRQWTSFTNTWIAADKTTLSEFGSVI